MDGLIQVVDEQDNPIGEATKDELWKKGLWHRIVRVVAEDEEGRVLLQKRAPHKQPYPNRWDNSAAGHVDVGESYEQAAHRELAEELGVTGATLEPLGGYQSQRVQEWRKLNRFSKIYRVRIDPAHVHVDEPDIAEVRWFTVQEIKQLIKEHPGNVTAGLCYVMEHYY